MSTNIIVVQNIQRKINAIDVDAPMLLKRLEVILTADAISKLLTQPEGNLEKLRQLMTENTSQVTLPRVGNTVSYGFVYTRRVLLDQLKREVILFFQRLEAGLTWNVICDLCANGGRVVVAQTGEHGPLLIIEIYRSHIEEQYEERLMEQRRQEAELSSSSDDSCNRLIW